MKETLQCPSVKELLSAYRDRKFFFDPMGGNHGDKLIELGSMETFKRLEIQLIRNPRKAEFIVINGGGGMTPLWGYGLQILGSYSKNFPHTPLIVLPSSWDVRDVDIASLLKNHKAPIYLYARDPYSFAILKKIKFANDVRVGLDHDMAFNLQGTLFLKRLNERRAERHLLIVERGDVESPTGKKHLEPLLIRLIKLSIPKEIRHCLPQPVLSSLRSMAYSLDRLAFGRKRRKEAARSKFAKQSVELVKRKHPEFDSLPVYAADISLPSFCSFWQFSLAVAQAAVVVTTRLHVGILGALLDKPTYLKAGNWHKIKGVYEYSLKDRNNVYLI